MPTGYTSVAAFFKPSNIFQRLMKKIKSILARFSSWFSWKKSKPAPQDSTVVIKDTRITPAAKTSNGMKSTSNEPKWATESTTVEVSPKYEPSTDAKPKWNEPPRDDSPRVTSFTSSIYSAPGHTNPSRLTSFKSSFDSKPDQAKPAWKANYMFLDISNGITERETANMPLRDDKLLNTPTTDSFASHNRKFRPLPHKKPFTGTTSANNIFDIPSAEHLSRNHLSAVETHPTNKPPRWDPNPFTHDNSHPFTYENSHHFTYDNWHPFTYGNSHPFTHDNLHSQTSSSFVFSPIYNDHRNSGVRMSSVAWRTPKQVSQVFRRFPATDSGIVNPPVSASVRDSLRRNGDPRVIRSAYIPAARIEALSPENAEVTRLTGRSELIKPEVPVPNLPVRAKTTKTDVAKVTPSTVRTRKIEIKDPVPNLAAGGKRPKTEDAEVIPATVHAKRIESMIQYLVLRFAVKDPELRMLNRLL
ncbi:uncharacterized protein PHALS_06955 [Plasmopara halstedii]|uniref:Uncharacterized protein n=1 Tax=Plasmopara halstedii TaxID=4781 RepID=A0A0P1B375_PLAHL|nr:uncharacterized protein PHALS_06955 [Plasmopara halstedii]CEG49177.1 hypothetical protein PHALS_06955 [Plasmopara halstedii]|eukprot:XP_024585546.1 hypothetical protein PHALS_06955 [Plasmopara halstedii]